MERLDIISPSSEQFCCGTTCPRKEVQKRINRMQSAIDAYIKYIEKDIQTFEEFEPIHKEFKELSTE